MTPWTVARQAPLSLGFSRQEYWSGLLCPFPGDLPDPGLKRGLPYCRHILYHLSHQRTREAPGVIAPRLYSCWAILTRSPSSILNIWTFLVSQVLRPSLNDSFRVHVDLQSSNQIYFSNQNFHQKPYSQPLCIACITLICIWSHNSFHLSIDKYLFSTLISDAKLYGNMMLSHWRRE